MFQNYLCFFGSCIFVFIKGPHKFLLLQWINNNNGHCCKSSGSNVGGSQSLKRVSYTSLTNRISYITTKDLWQLQQEKNKQINNDVKLKLHLKSSCLKDDSLSHLDSNSNSPTEMLESFYKCINEQNLKELNNYISEACLIDDSLFDEPFIWKKVKQAAWHIGRTWRFPSPRVALSLTSWMKKKEKLYS